MCQMWCDPFTYGYSNRMKSKNMFMESIGYKTRHIFKCIYPCTYEVDSFFFMWYMDKKYSTSMLKWRTISSEQINWKHLCWIRWKPHKYIDVFLMFKLFKSTSKKINYYRNFNSIFKVFTENSYTLYKMIQTTLKMCTYFQCKLKISTFNKNVLDTLSEIFRFL